MCVLWLMNDVIYLQFPERTEANYENLGSSCNVYLIQVPLFRQRKVCAENYLKLCTGVLKSP